jgi:hypothetical protein
VGSGADLAVGAVHAMQALGDQGVTLPGPDALVRIACLTAVAVDGFSGGPVDVEVLSG